MMKLPDQKIQAGQKSSSLVLASVLLCLHMDRLHTDFLQQHRHPRPRHHYHNINLNYHC